MKSSENAGYHLPAWRVLAEHFCRAAFNTTILLAAAIVFAAPHVYAGEAGSAAVISMPPPGSELSTYTWRRVAIGGGGFITGYDSDRDGRTRVARADVHGAYIWRSDKDRWVQLVGSATMPSSYRQQDGVNEGVYEIVVAPSRPSRIFMAVKGRIFRSDDRGATFIEIANGLPKSLQFHPNSETRQAGPFIAVSEGDADLVLLGTPQHGLWRSTNGGANWSQVHNVPLASVTLATQQGIPSGIMLWFERKAANSAARIWALSPGNGFFISADSGLTFQPLTPGKGPRELSQGAFAPDGSFFGVDPGSRTVWLYRGGAWKELVATGGISSAPYVAIAIDPRTSQVWIFDQGGRAYRSTDAGVSWSRVLHRSKPGAKDPPWLKISNQSYFAMGRVMFDPVVPGRIWAGTGTGVYYADTPNWLPWLTWVSESRGIEELVATDIIQGSGQAPLFAALDFGVHRKDDLFAFSETYGPKERVLIAVQQLAVTPAQPGFVATNASDTRITCCSEDGDAVLAGYSVDGGVRWQKFASLPIPPGGSPGDPWRMSFGAIAVSAGSADNIVWEPSFNRTPHYTTDRGKTWQPIRLEGRSESPGSHPQRFLQRKTLAADGLRSGTFYLAYPSANGSSGELAGLWRSIDGGRTWRHRYTSEISPNSGYAAKLRAVPGREGDLFFTSAVAGGSDLRLRRSRDGGATWQAVPGVEQVDDIAFGKAAATGNGPTIFISGKVDREYGIWRSDDDAGTWTMIGRHPVGSLDQVTVLGADPDRYGRVYIGYMGSGFVAGEARHCTPAQLQLETDIECFAVRTPPGGRL